MINEFENEILKAMKKFENKRVRVTFSGIIESRFDIEEFNYMLEDGILAIEDNDENYIDIDLEDIEKIYFESSENGYAMLEIDLEQGLEILMQTIDENIVTIKDKILNEIEKKIILAEILKREVCSA